MRLFLDSADESEVRYWVEQGVLDGVTTNPTLLLRSGNDRLSTIVKLADLVAPGVLHAQVTGVCGAALVNEGIELSGLADNIVVKVPVIMPNGAPLLREIAELAAADVRVNCTACLSLGQVVLAAKAGARYVSVLLGRVEDEGGDGAQLIADARNWLDDWNIPAQLVSASLRGPADFRRSVRAGAHCVSAPPAVLVKSVDHKYSRHTVQQFLDDARAAASAEARHE